MECARSCSIHLKNTEIGQPNIKLYMKAPSLRQIAERFGVTAGAVMKWKKAGCPVTSFEEVEAWRSKKVQDVPQTVTDAKLRKTLLECEKLQIAIDVGKNDLIDREEVYQESIGVASIFSAEGKAMLNDLPAQLAGLADENAIRSVLVARWNKLLRSIAERIGVEIAKE